MIPERPLPAASRPSPARAPFVRELIVVVMVLGGLALGGERLRMLLQYDRAALAAGEWWRLVTAHLVHLGWDHLALNVAGGGCTASSAAGASGSCSPPSARC